MANEFKLTLSFADSVPDLRTHYEIRKGWWIETKATVPCALPKDGLIVVFRREDVEFDMDWTYPHKGKGDDKKWYFNSTFDREVAEIDAEGRVSANPSVLWDLYMEPRHG